MKYIEQLPIGSTILAPSSMHPQLREHLLKEKDGLIGIQILSIESFLRKYTAKKSSNIYTSLFELKKMVTPLLNSLSIYQEIACSTTFLESCYHFIDACHFWNIGLSQLPHETNAQREIMQIFKACYDIPTPSQNILNALENIPNDTLHHVYIIEAFESIEHKKIIHALQQKGANLCPQEIDLCSKDFYHGVNKRQEIEAMAQYIIEHDLLAEDIRITLADSTYKPLLQQVFQRYEIPFTLLSNQQTSALAKSVLSLLNYHVSPTTQNALLCFDNNLFPIKGIAKLVEYIEIFECEVTSPFTHLQKELTYGNIMSAYEIDSLIELEKIACSVQDELLPLLDKLEKPLSYEALFTNILELLTPCVHTQQEKQVYQQITSLLQDVFPYIQSKEDILFIMPFIEKITSSQKATELQGCLVADLKQGLLSTPYHFLLGATQKNYPAFQKLSGIFDEDYVASIDAYPSMEERYALTLQQVDTLLHVSPHIIVSFPLGSYEGKANECALEIEQFMECKSLPYPLHNNFTPITNKLVIDSETAHRLFVHDKQIHGSISSIERYVKCPFSYFLRYGLSLKEPMKHGFPNSYAGTLLHYILEVLTTTYGKSYATTSIDKISKLLQSEIQVLEDLFPTISLSLENVKTRILCSLTQTLQALDEFEQHSSLQPYKSEYAFTYEIPLQDDIRIAMKGFIDRIDTTNSLACILDYKSSSKTLSEDNVFAALQLQLLTYAMVVQKDFGKDMLGAYYVSLKNENIPYKAGKLSRRKPVTHTVNSLEDMQDMLKKSHRFNGWALNLDIASLDDNGSHLVGVRMNKDGLVKASKVYSLSDVSEYLRAMYQKIGTQIIDGKIACTPIEDACTYCTYHEICRFNGSYRAKEPMVEVDDSIYQKGDEQDA
ncbi:MAG: PD-(D/E)XK nuclease family protein [Longicatena sp.]